MSLGPPQDTPPGLGTRLRPGFAVGLSLAATRAALFALRDGYYKDAELANVAARSFLDDLLVGALCTLPPALLLSAWLTRPTTSAGSTRREATGPRGVARLAVALGVAALAYLFLSGRLPASPFHVPGWESTRALLAQGVAAGLALVAARVLVASGGFFSWSLRLGAGLGLLAGAAAGLLLAPPVVPSTPSVIIVSLDTLRADRLGAHGSQAGLTPTLDALAAESLRFQRAYTPQPWTLSAHMSLLTGLSPSTHGLDAEQALPEAAVTLAESYREAGYVTVALVDTVAWLHPRFGFERGFQIYRQIEGDVRAKQEQLQLVLDDVGDRPLFLFVHLYDTHSDEHQLPYESEPSIQAQHTDWYTGDFRGCLPDRGCASELLQNLNKLGERL
ncbi:MAG: sulfatase-like hydrolase/transferase, partial [Planctomycetota bacterium]